MPSTLGPSAVEATQTRLSRSPHPYHRRKSNTSETLTTQTPSPGLTPSQSDLDLNATQRGNGTLHTRPSRSASDSGTEADDEALIFVKALPPSLVQSRKGLRNDWGNVPVLEPTETTSPAKYAQNVVDEKRQQLVKKRNQELLRRGSEVFLLVSIAGALIGNPRISGVIRGHYQGKFYLSSFMQDC